MADRVSDSKETALLGYFSGVVFLAIFFWLTLDDAYGRFMIDLNPGNSLMSAELELYTGSATGLGIPGQGGHLGAEKWKKTGGVFMASFVTCRTHIMEGTFREAG